MTNHMPSLSDVTYVITCVDELNFLHDLIKSIEKQVGKGTPSIFVHFDGTSTNLYSDFINSHQNVHTLYSSTSLGKSIGVNRVLNRVQTRYICLCDADDLIFPHKTLRQLEFLSNSSNYGFCGTNYLQLRDKSFIEVPLPSIVNHTPSQFLLGPPFLYSSLMFDIDKIGTLPFLDEQLSCAMDYQLSLEMTKHSSGANLQYPLTLYRIRENSITRSSKRSQQLVNHARLYCDYFLNFNDDLLNSLFISCFSLGLAQLASDPSDVIKSVFQLTSSENLHSITSDPRPDFILSKVHSFLGDPPKLLDAILARGMNQIRRLNIH